jgi:hypothetical protein
MTTHRARTRPEPSEELLTRVLRRVQLVPDRFKVFNEGDVEAKRKHGIDAGLLATLTELGLPAVSTGTGLRYDSLDLANVSLALALPSPRFMAMRGWSAAIRSASNAKPTTYVLSVEPHCPTAHEGPCVIEAAPHIREQPEYSRSPEGAITLTRHVPAQLTREFPEAAALTSLIQHVHFHLLPDELRADVAFLRETHLADCGLAARYLVREATALGLTARLSFGLFIALPYSVPHAWFDLFLDDQWVPFDPHLLNVMTGWGLLPAEQWPPHRSIGGAAWRLSKEGFQIARHVGRKGSMSFPTQSFPT